METNPRNHPDVTFLKFKSKKITWYPGCDFSKNLNLKKSLDIPDSDEAPPSSLQCLNSIWSATLAGLSKPKSKWSRVKTLGIWLYFDQGKGWLARELRMATWWWEVCRGQAATTPQALQSSAPGAPHRKHSFSLPTPSVSSLLKDVSFFSPESVSLFRLPPIFISEDSCS